MSYVLDLSLESERKCGTRPANSLFIFLSKETNRRISIGTVISAAAFSLECFFEFVFEAVFCMWLALLAASCLSVQPLFAAPALFMALVVQQRYKPLHLNPFSKAVWLVSFFLFIGLYCVARSH